MFLAKFQCVFSMYETISGLTLTNGTKINLPPKMVYLDLRLAFAFIGRLVLIYS